MPNAEITNITTTPMSFPQDFSEITFPRFLARDALRTALITFTGYTDLVVHIMVPFLVKGDLLDSILSLPVEKKVILVTRNARGYLPNIHGAPTALEKLLQRKNTEVWINNSIHAKIWLVDSKITIVHSMNGTRGSEYSNFEAGIMAINSDLLDEVQQYFQYVIGQSTRLTLVR